MSERKMRHYRKISKYGGRKEMVRADNGTIYNVDYNARLYKGLKKVSP